jgi:hypothetical protein
VGLFEPAGNVIKIVSTRSVNISMTENYKAEISGK